jgi:hypothetical protein
MLELSDDSSRDVKILPDGRQLVDHEVVARFIPMRRAEAGHHQRISGVNLGRYARESAWREDMRRVDNGR